MITLIYLKLSSDTVYVKAVFIHKENTLKFKTCISESVVKKQCSTCNLNFH